MSKSGRPKNKEPRKIQVSSYVSEKEKRQINLHCDKQGISESKLIRDLLLTFLKN